MAADAKLLAQIELVGDIDEWIVDAVCDPTCDAYRGPNGGGCSYCIAKFIADKLTAAGRLLPPGGEVSTQYAVHATGKDGRRMPGLVVHHSLAAAQKWKARLEADRSIGKVTLTIHQRQAHIWEDGWEHYTPWSPVVSDNSEVPSG